jgi:hypothetical protein
MILKTKSAIKNWECWFVAVIPALERLRQFDREFQDGIG